MLLESQAAGPSRRALNHALCTPSGYLRVNLRHRPAAAKSLEAVPEPFAVVWVNPSLCSGQGFCEVPRLTNSQNVSKRCLRVLRAIRCYQPAKCLAVPEGFVTSGDSRSQNVSKAQATSIAKLLEMHSAGPSRRALKRIVCTLRHRPAAVGLSSITSP